MQDHIASAKMPGGWRRAKLVSGGLAVTMAAFGGLAAIALPASASTIESATYVIGTAPGSPTNVSASASNTTGGDKSLYTITFKSPDGSLSSGSTITLTESDTAGSIWAGMSTTAPATLETDVVVEDESNLSNYTPQSPTTVTRTGNTLAITLGGTGTIPAGDTVMVQISATNPSISSATSYTIGVSTSADNTSANAAPITLSAGAAAAGVTASTDTLGTNTLYTFSSLLTGGSGDTAYLELEASSTTTPGTGETVETAWNSASSGYTVTFTPSGGTLTTASVTGVAFPTTGDTADVVLTLGTSIPAGSTVNVTAYGANPTTNDAVDTYAVAFPTGNTSPLTASTVTPPTITSSITFGNSVSDVTVTPSPASASSSATYTVSFKTTTALTTAGTVTITLPSDTTLAAGAGTAVVTDPTSGLLNSSATTSATGDVLTVTPDLAIAAGDTVNITFTGVTNPSTTETETTATVSTSADVIAATAASYAIGVSTAGAPTVSVSPNTPGVTATYTISGFTSTGATAGVQSLVLVGNAGTIFPSVAGDYTITDSTTPSGSGTATAVSLNTTAVAGPNGVTGTDNQATITTPNIINSGDHLTITVADVINPASGNQNLDVEGDVGAVTLPVFPDAGITYPNGGIVNFNGTYYVFAGGHAFGFPTVAKLEAVQAVDHATVQTAASGITVPTATARVGTLIVVSGSPEVWVVGTDGDLHGFASPTQLLQDGYDGADIITVPNTGGLTVSTTTVGQLGTAATALATSSDGAIVNDSGTFYVFAGGRAFGIPTPAALTAVLAGNPYSTPQTGTISSASTSATIASGVVVTVKGSVWVSYNGELFEFKGMTQLANDGYSGTPSIILPGADGITTVSSYAGS